MALSQATQSWQRYYYFLLFLFIMGLLSRGGLWGYEYYLSQQAHQLDAQIQTKNDQIASLLQEKNFAHYLQVQKFKAQSQQLPWSQYIDKILYILESIREVEASRGGVTLSDFKIDMQKLSLEGVVSNLRVLYGNRNGSWGLIESFNQLDFLSDITIRKYEKAQDDSPYYTFTLSANILNNVSTGSHQ